ncbi:Sec34-domain-containing protein [Aureobasidium pullulans]|uniref:Conserved oligomeric Golgi complex subunit 3 n=1 Tax=Aureobasidium pullulans TaxID=5580 RepID=A0A4V4LGH8_AURPU|nr:Sec34-domain-containing protein [Aureobasidium pullulans]
MMDDWYTSFAPSTPASSEKSPGQGHRRRASLLQQPNEARQADDAADQLPRVTEEDDNSLNKAPPPPTLVKRALSYTDFHNAAESTSHATIAPTSLRKNSLTSAPKPKHVLQSNLDFAEWYDALEDDLLDASHDDYSLYYDQLKLSQHHLDSLMESTADALTLLSSLSDSFKAVDEQTTAFQAQCESLMTEQRRITDLAENMNHNLQYYAYLEPMTRRLNAPGAANLVRAKEFPDMLTNLDQCLEYMQAHPTHREAPTYRSRYRLLLTRALTLIRVYFTNSLRALAADASQRIADRQLNDTTQTALLYSKFRVDAPELKQLGLEIQKRAVLPAGADQGGEAEYQSLMNELHQSYSATRGRLMFPIITRKLTEMASVDNAVGDLVTFARTAIGFVRGICLDEYDLWSDWFSGDGGVYEFLEAMCEPLYDHLRPRTIRETRIPKLCELCTFIQTRFMIDEEDDDAEYQDIDSGKRSLDFAALVKPALEDAQSRLVFLALAVLRDEIENYRPKPEDLDYPSQGRGPSTTNADGKRVALSGRKNSTNTTQVKSPGEEDDAADMFEPSWITSEKQGIVWYPTLRKAVWLLSRIYRLVNSTVFDDLAHNIVHSTTVSLAWAASQIATKSSPADANLFLIAHLLRLKQQIVAFDIEFVTPEVTFDFSSVTNTFYELRERGGLWNPASWVKLAAGGLMPRVVENMLDAKAELDGRLRAVINDFVNSFVGPITTPLAAPRKEPGPEPSHVTAEVRTVTQKEVASLRSKLDEYIQDVRTRETLVAAVRDQVILAYEEWMDKLSEGKGAAKIGKVSKKGKGREDEVWSSEVFAEWCERVFAVGQVASDADSTES